MSRRVRIFLRDTIPARSAPTDTGVAFLAGLSQKGTQEPLLVRSMSEFETRLGTRQSYSIDYDWADEFFREGGNRLYYSRALGPAAAVATVNLASTGTTLIVDAVSKGDWANGATGGLTVEVVAGPSGGTYRVLIIRLNGVEVERTPEFLARDDAVTWSQNSSYVRVRLGGGSGQPTVAAAANLAGGTDDRASITQTQIDAALGLLVHDLGPGQVAAPNWQTTATHSSLLAHAAARNRFALCDPTDTTSKATLLTAAAAVQGNANGSYGALVAPWLSVSGGASSTSRSVPASAFVAAKAAQTDARHGAVQAPAGENGQATSSATQTVKATFSDIDQAELEDAGVSLIVLVYGGVRFDSNRTLVEPLGGDNEWLQASVARYRMGLIARLEPIAVSRTHVRITPYSIAQFDDAISGVLLIDEQNEQLFRDPDDPPGSSFIVETGDSVNTPTSITAGELNAAVAFRPAPGADFVNIYLTKVAVNQTVAA